MCLACPNAVATARHLPRLAYLHQALDDLRAALAAEVWEQDWREHFLRVDALRKTHVPTALWLRERGKITDSDRAVVDRMLTRKLDAR